MGSSASSSFGLADHGAGEADALLLAAGQGARQVGQAAAEADFGKRRGGAVADRRSRAVPASAISSVSATFSSAVIEGMRWKFWNRMPRRLAAEDGELVLVQCW